jgi:hypothetical protein
VAPTMFDAAVEIFTGHLRHVQVGQDDVMAPVGEQFKRFTTALYGIDMVTAPPQYEVKQLPCIGFILDHQMR